MASADNTLGTIEESGLSDAMFSGPSSRNDSGSSGGHNTPDFGLEGSRRRGDEGGVDDDNEEFVYEESVPQTRQSSDQDSDEENFRYTVSPTFGSTATQPELPVVTSQTLRPQPSPAQLEAIFAAASSGDLAQLQRLFEKAQAQTDTAAFALANDASQRTGLTALHGAASRGHIDVVRWLIEECGAMTDMEDKEGETALHKAALNGHYDLVVYLLSLPIGKSDVHARDADGWTPLHNACSKGYLDIVKYLCEKGGAADITSTEDFSESIRGIDAKSNGGWTPLMNAASKGHLPVVLYLLAKQSADPLVRNKWGETAFDIAAGVFEIWICEILQKAEVEKWRGGPYNTLGVHTTVPLILYENQRLDSRLKTLAVSGGRPKFSASGLGRRGRRSPFELKLPPGMDANKQLLPAWRSDVQLPLLDDPFQIPKPKGMGDSHLSREGSERSHFWLSDWTLDATHPRGDVDEGWQYARSFDDPDDQWSAEMPPALERALAGYGVLTPGIAGTSSAGGSNSQASSSQLSWVRRRRWVRVMRRRLDMTPLPFLQPNGTMYQLDSSGLLIPYVEEDMGDPDGGQELGVIPQSFLTSQDYVARARHRAGSPRGYDMVTSDGPMSGAELRKSIAKLEAAVLELRAGMLSDENQDRKMQAEVLLNAYNRELERQRLTAGAGGLFRVDDEDELSDSDDDDSDGSFHYPDASSSVRALSVRSHSTDYFSRPSTSRASTDLTPQLSQAPEFRVPTHESPQNILTPRPNPVPHSIDAQWERDEAVMTCRGCSRRFTLFIRKHHCRRCGLIFCDRCSSHRVVLDPEDIARGPSIHMNVNSSTTTHRVCTPCYDIVNANVPGKFQGIRNASIERVVVRQGHLAVPNNARSDVNSQISDLADCPVCGKNLAELGTVAVQENHIKGCLEGPRDSLIEQPVRYLTYTLPGESALIGVECVICLEEFLKDSVVARLSCLCSFHNTCLSAWLKRGKGCPCHSR